MVELKKNKRIYAMKVIKKELVTDDEDIDWVQTEKHVFETASNHPFLVGLHSCFQVIHISDFRQFHVVIPVQVVSIPYPPQGDVNPISIFIYKAVFHCYRRRRGCSS